jgi:hypothetical protein
MNSLPQFVLESLLLTEKRSNLSPGAKVVIIVLSSLAALALVVGVLYAFHRRRMAIKYQEKLLSPFKDVDYGKREDHLDDHLDEEDFVLQLRFTTHYTALNIN